jgi:hypothetical protein
MAARAQSAMRFIPADAFGFERVSVEAPVPEGFVDQQVAAIVGNDNLLSALVRVVATCPTGNLEDVRAHAQAGDGVGTFAAIFGTTVLNAELLPNGVHAGDDLDAAIARLQDIHLYLVLPILSPATNRPSSDTEASPVSPITNAWSSHRPASGALRDRP